MKPGFFVGQAPWRLTPVFEKCQAVGGLAYNSYGNLTASLARRGRRETDIQVINQRREIGHVYSRLSVDVGFCLTAKRSERDIQIVNKGRQI